MRAFVEIRKVMTQQYHLAQQFQDLKQELEIRLAEQDTQIIGNCDVFQMYNIKTTLCLLDFTSKVYYYSCVAQ